MTTPIVGSHGIWLPGRRFAPESELRSVPPRRLVLALLALSLGAASALGVPALAISPSTNEDLTALEKGAAPQKGAAHKTYPTHGVQFHPESIASENGHLILKNFLELADAWNTATGRRKAH